MKRDPGSINVSVRNGEPYLINWNARTYVVRRILDKRLVRKGFRKREVYLVETDKEEMEISTTRRGWKLDRVLEPGILAENEQED